MFAYESPELAYLSLFEDKISLDISLPPQTGWFEIYLDLFQPWVGSFVPHVGSIESPVGLFEPQLSLLEP